MAYQATVIPVMIASPSDVPQERRVAREVIHEWNYVNSQTRRTVLIPTGWETHSAPEIGSSTAQELINTRILEYCDLLVGVFWTRLGTPTGRSASGTAEEIERHINAGKPALVYFSSAPVIPDSLNHDQYKAVLNFRNWCQQKGLIQVFNDTDHFRNLFTSQLAITLNQNSTLQNLTTASTETEQPNSENRITISSEAIQLLLSASEADDNGTIMRIGTLGGLTISSGRRTFGSPESRREMAAWDQALKELANYGFIQDMGYKGEVFELTSSGYNAADQARTAGHSLPPQER